MNIRELKEKLESITGDSPVDIARRLAIMALIGELMNREEQ